MSGPAPVNKVPEDAGNVTNLLLRWSDGDSSASERLTRKLKKAPHFQ